MVNPKAKQLKTKAGGKGNGTSRNIKRRRGKKSPSGGAGTDGLLRGAINMVLDPCGSQLLPSAYSGQTGIVQRFSLTTTYTTTNPYRVITWVPGRFRSWEASVLTGSTSTTVSLGSAVPGAAFLTANSSSARVLGACIDVAYLGKELDRSGFVAVGVVPSGTAGGGALITPDSLTSRLAAKGRVPPTDFSVKWYPSDADNEYVNIADGTPGGEDFSNANAIMMTTSGMPTGAQLMVTYTCIVEWNPKQDTGTIVNTLSAPSVPDAVSRINTNLHRLGRWWTNIGDVSKQIKTTYNAVYSGATEAMHLAKEFGGIAMALV